MKLRVIIISVLALVLVIAIGAVIYVNSKQLKIEFYEDAEVNINESVDNYRFVKTLENGEILTEKEMIDTKTTGLKNIMLTVKTVFGEEKTFSYSVMVVDRVSPEIKFTDHLETTVGVEIDLLEGVTATDNSGEDITVSVEGSYDIETAGEYKLKYIAFDYSMNKAEEEFLLTVMAQESEQPKEPAQTPTQEPKPEESAPAPTASNSTESENKQDSAKPKEDAIYFTTSKGFSGVIKDGVTYIDGYLVANKTYALPKNYGNGLTDKTKSPFKTMSAAAKNDGLDIYISSGFRSYDYQNNLYNKYVKRDGVKKADTYSARAGHSEHQSGLAFDVNIINDSFIGTPEAIWLADNCYKYGFILRYPKDKTNETGYKYEPWHFRYVGEELASKLYNGGDWVTMEDYFGITSEYQD